MKEPEGDDTNAILAVCGGNLRLILKLISFWLKIILGILLKIFNNFLQSNEQENKIVVEAV